MFYSTLEALSEKVSIPLHAFFVDAALPPSLTSEWKKNGIVPEYVAPMLLAFFEKELSLLKADEERKKIASFFSRALSLGYSLDDHGYIVIPLGGTISADFEISESEQKYVRYTVL